MNIFYLFIILILFISYSYSTSLSTKDDTDTSTKKLNRVIVSSHPLTDHDITIDISMPHQIPESKDRIKSEKEKELDLLTIRHSPKSKLIRNINLYNGVSTRYQIYQIYDIERCTTFPKDINDHSIRKWILKTLAYYKRTSTNPSNIIEIFFNCLDRYNNQHFSKFEISYEKLNSILTESESTVLSFDLSLGVLNKVNNPILVADDFSSREGSAVLHLQVLIGKAYAELPDYVSSFLKYKFDIDDINGSFNIKSMTVQNHILESRFF